MILLSEFACLPIKARSEPENWHAAMGIRFFFPLPKSITDCPLALPQISPTVFYDESGQNISRRLNVAARSPIASLQDRTGGEVVARARSG